MKFNLLSKAQTQVTNNEGAKAFVTSADQGRVSLQEHSTETKLFAKPHGENTL